MPRSPKRSSSAASSEGSEVPDNGTQWVCVELSSSGEREKDIPSIVKSARQILGRPNIDVFVPAVSEKVRNESHTMVYMDGYVFIRHEDGVQYMKLEDTNYFKSVLRTSVMEGGQRRYKYSLLADKSMDSMRRGVQDLKVGHSRFSVGQQVTVVKGEFKNLPGEVSEVYDSSHVQISIKLRSKPILMDFPISFLNKVR